MTAMNPKESSCFIAARCNGCYDVPLLGNPQFMIVTTEATMPDDNSQASQIPVKTAWACLTAIIKEKWLK